MFYFEITDCSTPSNCVKCGVTDNECTECAAGFVVDNSNDCAGKYSLSVVCIAAVAYKTTQ